MPSIGERFVIQRKLRDGSFVDWVDPMGGPMEFATHDQAAFVIRRRTYACTRLDFRVIRRVWSFVDFVP